MSGRVAAAGIALGGILVAIAPWLEWFGASLAAGEVRSSGLSVAGELWTLPLLGVVLAASAIVLVRTDATDPAYRWSATGALLTALLATGASLVAVLTVPVTLVADDIGGSESVGVPAMVLTFGPAVAFAGASIAALGALAKARRGFRR